MLVSLRRQGLRALLAAAGLLLLVAPRHSARAQSAPAARGTITGVVRAAPTNVALPYAVVAIPALGTERFSGADGRYVLTDVPVGTHQLSVRRIGFVPQQIAVTVTAGGVTQADLALVQIPVRLTSLTVRPVEPCRTPGLPDPRKEPAIAELVGLLRENAATYKTLAQQHPYAYAQVRALGTTERETAVLSNLTAERIDGIREVRYRRGRVVTTQGGQSMMQLPSILDLTDREFIANHCFHYRGTSTHDRETWFALEVRAAERLRSPDVHGIFYLDSATAQLRRMELELSRVDRLPSSLRGIRAVQVRTTFLDIAPGLSVVDDVCAINWLVAPSRGTPRHPLELQHVQAVAFLNSAPPDVPMKRDFPNPPWIAGGRMPLAALSCNVVQP